MDRTKQPILLRKDQLYQNGDKSLYEIVHFFEIPQQILNYLGLSELAN